MWQYSISSIASTKKSVQNKGPKCLFTGNKTPALSIVVHYYKLTKILLMEVRDVAIYRLDDAHVCKYNACLGNMFVSWAM